MARPSPGIVQQSPTCLYSPVKPSLTTSQVVDLCTKLYGIVPGQAVQLPGYDDQNFWIKKADAVGNNKHLNCIWPDGYVLKITNSNESENVGLIEAQVKVLLHLGACNVSAPLPVANINGHHFSLERIKGEDKTSKIHAVRLLTFVGGDVLLHVPVNLDLSKHLGIFLYKLDCCLKTFDHPSFKDRDLLFMLEKTPSLKHFLHVIKDESREAMVLETVEQFERKVIPRLQQLEQGFIHADFNEQNVLIIGNEVTGILDFGDCHYAPYLFEIAIGIAYLLMLTSDFEMCRRFLEGYTLEKKLTKLEETLLPICVRARICQSLVLGLYAHSQNPDNLYVLSSQKKGWEMLGVLCAEQDHLLLL